MKTFVLALAAVAVTGSAFAQAINEGFDTVGGTTSNGQLGGAALEASGWYFDNQSEPRGVLDWYQGVDTVFPSHAGAPTAYIATNWNSAGNTPGNHANWALTPVRTLNNGDVVKFWTRTFAGSIYPDRLQFRMSLSGASNNVGTGYAGTGDFTTLIHDINPTLAQGGYPETWTEYTYTVSGLGGPTSGRFAFKYYVQSGGPLGLNANYIGIDTFSYTPGAPAEESFPPSSYQVVQGTYFGGNVGSLASSDNQYLLIICDEFDSTGEIRFNATSPAGSITQWKLRFEGKASRNDLSQFVDMYNYSSNSYVQMNSGTTTLTDSVKNITVTTNVTQYRGGSNEVSSRVRYVPQNDIDAGDGWSMSVDQVLWTLVH